MRRIFYFNQSISPSRFAVALSLLMAAALSLSAALPPEALAARHHSKAAAAKAPAPAVSDQPYAEAAVMEPTTGTFIFEKNDHQPWPPRRSQR